MDKKPFDLYTLSDLTDADRLPPEFIVDSMIPVGLSFLSGAPKLRKSFLALQLSSAVASGKPFLSHNTIKCSVLYLDLEGSKNRIAYRADRMNLAHTENLFITNTVQHKLAGGGLVNDLHQLRKENPSFRLFVIDTFSRARGNVRAGSANAYDSDVSLLEPVQRWALDNQVAVLCVHHDKKGAGFAQDSFERLSGTMGISGSADSVLNLIADGKRFEGRATLEFTPRDAQGGEMHIEFDSLCGVWRVVDTAAMDITTNSIVRYLLDNLPDKRREGVFFPYDAVYSEAYHLYSETAGDKIREELEPLREQLFLQYGAAIQMGVQSHGRRGIRLINVN